jgi:hypothetical protein
MSESAEMNSNMVHQRHPQDNRESDRKSKRYFSFERESHRQIDVSR